MAHIEDRWLRADRTHTPLHGKGLRWRVIWRDETGKRSMKSFRNKDAARAYLTQVEHAALSGDVVTREVRDRRLGYYWGRYEPRITGLSKSAQSRTRSAWAKVSDEFGGQPLRVIRKSAVSTWLTGMVSQRGTPAGLHTKRAAHQLLSALLDMAIEDGVIRTNPARGVKITARAKREHVYLTPAQLGSLLSATPGDWQLFVDFLASTGVRVGEAVGLRGGALDAHRWRVEVYGSKTDETRQVPIPPHLREPLCARATEVGPRGLLFTTPRGAQVHPENFRNRVFASAAAAAGLPERIVVHDLRHTFASNLLAAGVSVKTVQEILGHASPLVTLEVYAGVFDEDVDAAGEAISKRYGRSL